MRRRGRRRRSASCTFNLKVQAKKFGVRSDSWGYVRQCAQVRLKWSNMKGVKDKQKEEVPGVVTVFDLIRWDECRKVCVGETRRTAAQRAKEHKVGKFRQDGSCRASTTGHHILWKAMGVEREQQEKKILLSSRVRSPKKSQNGDRFPWKLRRVPIAWSRHRISKCRRTFID